MSEQRTIEQVLDKHGLCHCAAMPYAHVHIGNTAVSESPGSQTIPKEQPSSNLVARLRKYLIAEDYELTDFLDAFEKAADYIEQLEKITRENVLAAVKDHNALIAERDYLRGSLEQIASGSLDDMPPFRAAPHDVLRKYAQKALDWPRAADETTCARCGGTGVIESDVLDDNTCPVCKGHK